MVELIQYGWALLSSPSHPAGLSNCGCHLDGAHKVSSLLLQSCILNEEGCLRPQPRSLRSIIAKCSWEACKVVAAAVIVAICTLEVAQ